MAFWNVAPVWPQVVPGTTRAPPMPDRRRSDLLVCGGGGEGILNPWFLRARSVLALHLWNSVLLRTVRACGKHQVSDRRRENRRS
jgi:hypothetical protein